MAGRARTPMAALFRTDHPDAQTHAELVAWRRHVAREALGSANLLANRLALARPPAFGGGPLALSFLSSSAGAAGGWEVPARRREVGALTRERLELLGAQRLASSGSLPTLVGATDDAAIDDIPPDFLPSASRSTLLARTDPAEGGQALRYGAVGSTPLLSASSNAQQGLWPPQRRGAPFRSPLDYHRPRPRPLISQGPGVRSALVLRGHAGMR